MYIYVGGGLSQVSWISKPISTQAILVQCIVMPLYTTTVGPMPLYTPTAAPKQLCKLSEFPFFLSFCPISLLRSICIFLFFSLCLSFFPTSQQ